MKRQTFTGAYQPDATRLSRLTLTQRLLVVAVWSGVILTGVALPDVLGLAIGLTLLSGWAQLHTESTLRRWGLLLIAVIAVFFSPNWLQPWLLLVFKIMLLNRLMTYAGQIIPPRAALQWLQQRSDRPVIHALVYLLETTWRWLPTVRYDINRAIDARHMRLGRRPAAWQIGIWAEIILSTVERSVRRAARLGQHTVERGYRLDQPLPVPADTAPTSGGGGQWVLLMLVIAPLIWRIGWLIRAVSP